MASSRASSAAHQVVVVLGAGPGLGFSCARAFARRGHPVALLSRTLSRLQTLAGQINDECKDPQRAHAYNVDATKRQDLFDTMRKIADDAKARDSKAFIHTAIMNNGGQFMMKPFMEVTEEDLHASINGQSVSFFNFAQAYLGILQETEAWKTRDNGSPEAVGNILVTGATASLRGGAKLSAFAASNFALRAICQSVAREYMPQGVHVAHFLIDGIIHTERTDGFLGSDYKPNTRMEPDDIAEVYVHTAQQPRSVWGFEVDLRPFAEKW